MMVLDGPHASWPAPDRPSAVTIGVFDGVHLGHRSILQRVVSDEVLPVVLTFDPHPAEVLSPGAHPRLITTVSERIEILAGLGVEMVGVLDLSLIRMLSPAEFVSRILVEKLNVARLVVGNDFHFGRDRAGDVPFLIDSGAGHGFEVDVVDLLTDDGVVSSSRIRGLIEMGSVAEAGRLLGSTFALSNAVIAGDRRGRTLGFPTANLDIPARKVVPGNGIYAAEVIVDGVEHQAAVNVGTRPTFGESGRVIEAHLLDFDADIYGRTMQIRFVERLRSEVAFDTVEGLVAQIEEDVVQTRRILGGA
jgi:riboflavin kinase / FMN adenylyltransferase